MNEIIDRLYKTRTVVGQSGKVHRLKSEIDRYEGEFIAKIISNDPKIINTLEVGCAYGLSSLYICSALKERPGVSHIIIDPFQSNHWDGSGVKHLEEAGVNFFDLIEAKSEIALPKLLSDKEGKLDFIFIDGWHTFDHTLLDCFYATRLLRVGGYLVIDDVSFPAIERVVDFLKTYPCYEEYASLGANKSKSLKKAVVRGLLSLIPRKLLSKILVHRLYRTIFFEDRGARMVALKKINEDTRKWNWHDNSF